MNKADTHHLVASAYDTSACEIGIVHLGYGAFHRAHQAVYIDRYMAQSGDLRWGIAAVNLRAAESAGFASHSMDQDGYILKSVTPEGDVALSRIRSHVAFHDGAQDRAAAQDLLTLPSVHLVTITVTESGYYTAPDGTLNLQDPTIAFEITGQRGTSVYAYLAASLQRRRETTGAPLTIACCDNIRSNGKMLQRNFAAYLVALGADDLAEWVAANVAFPCSMVDRITPRAADSLADHLTRTLDQPVQNPVMAEAFIQWVLEDNFAAPMPDLASAGVTVTDNVDPFEETKIRVLNGGHTCLCYLAALQGVETFDQAMQVPALFDHFRAYETNEVLPALTLDLPFSKAAYLDDIAARFKNPAIADTVARICADGFAKFPIFIRPTLEGCLSQGILPRHGITSIASWHTFARHVAAGKIPFEYIEPSWPQLKPMLGTDDFVTSQQLWGDLPSQYPEFAYALRAAITEMEDTWPI